ncbi:MAG: phosphatase PAP2 family protein [Acidimicrobiales bacterium]
MALGLYGLGFVAACLTWGVPLDRELVIGWVCGARACASIGRSWRAIARLALDWAPFAAVLVLYDYTRGAADTLGMPVHVQELVDAERWLFGGEIPTIWLQERLVDIGQVHWWDVVFTLTYCSYFIVPFVVAGVLWARDRPSFLAYKARYLTLTFAGLATYILYPAAPPWLAARDKLLHGRVFRTAGRGWSVIGLDVARRVLERGQATTNLVAAVPSLHAGVTALVSLFLWRRVNRGWRPLLAAYPLLMGLTLVATGEHYVVDVVLGYGYAVIVMAAWSFISRRSAAPPPA